MNSKRQSLAEQADKGEANLVLMGPLYAIVFTEVNMNKKCQVFTPPDYVEKLLDSVGYKHNLYGKRILENSCGDGNILTAAVLRYIEDCRTQGMSRTKIKNGLEKDICGFEIDSEHYIKCIDNLDRIVKK